MSVLEIRGLQVSVNTENGSVEILKGVDLTIKSGETHAIMGPNGSGKSTLAYSIAGHPKYTITGGSVTLDGVDVLEMTVDERAKAGLFLAMQYPVEVPGVSVSNFLRTAATALRGEAPKLRTWVGEVKDAMEALNNNASYYLLKPIHDREFKKGMDLVLERIKRKKIISTILVSHKNMQVPLNISQILYLKSEGAYSHIITKNEHYLSSKSIGHYEQLLTQSGFLRSHNSFLVNAKHITRLVKGRSGTLILSNGDEIPVSQRKLNDFMTLIQG